MSERHTTTSEMETSAVGRSLGHRLRVGDVVLLSGPLGAGKTAFVRGLAEGLGCDPAAVSSPTFTIVQEYDGPVRLQHVDLYRLTAPEVEDLGLDEMMSDAVIAVEWPDRWGSAPGHATLVRLSPAGGDRRDIEIDYSTR